jgi:mono/diheme cytochrome c family protein
LPAINAIEAININMTRPLLSWTFIFSSLLFYSGTGLAQNSQSRVAELPSKHAAVFQKYCYDCHDNASQEAGIDLEKIPFKISSDIPTAERWSKILNAINSGEMPPKDSQQISAGEKTDFLADLSIQIVMARKILSDSGGVITMRRLNRREYQNTIESLLGVRPDVSNLPDDQASTKYDTTGASLFFSSDQLEHYLAAAKATLQLSLKPSPDKKSKTVRVEPEEYYNKFYAEAAAELKDREIRAAAYFAQKGKKPPSEFGFLDEYQVKKQRKQEWLPLLNQYLKRPETKTGATLIMTIKQGGSTKIKLPSLGTKDDGRYTIRLRAAHYPEAEERFHYLEFSSGSGGGRKRHGWRKVTGTLDNPEIIEFPIEHRPGIKTQYWVHQRTHQDRGDKNLATLHMKENGIGTTPGIWIDWAELVGPHPENIKTKIGKNDSATSLGQVALVSSSEIKPNAKPNKILFEKPDGWSEKQYAKEVLNRFATRAFRGEEPNPGYLDRLVEQYAGNRAQGLNPRDSLLEPLAIVLTSPSFLYMVESKGSSGTSLLTQNELAVRLSFLLWSAPPDDELMEAVRKGELSDPKVLKNQTNRLLSDKRSNRFVKSLVHQWLEMERLDMFQFLGRQFPTFDNAVRENAREEIFETVLHMIKEKLPLASLLKSDFVVVNDLMAGYYEIPGVKGHEFRKVKVPEDSLRGGLLGTAAVLAMGSDGLRSSPVERGAWVLRHLINDPPPPAPPNVPQLSRLDGEVLSARELQKAHQEEPQCAQCHQKIDPIGYALENFDASGLWRDKETIVIGRRNANKTKDFDIDPRGELPGGKSFADYHGLRDAVAEYPDEFARSFTEALIEYGLGRAYGFTDQDLADEILNQAKSSEYEISEFVHALVQSKQFRSK